MQKFQLLSKNECLLYFKFVGKTLHKSKPYHCQFCSLKYDTRGKAYNHISKKHLKELEKMKNLPCYSNPEVQDNFTKRIREVCEKEEISDEDTEIVKIFAPLTNNPNAPDKDGETPIHKAARRGNTKIVKILWSLIDNPNAPDKYGKTPLYWAAQYEYTENVKILTAIVQIVLRTIFCASSIAIAMTVFCLFFILSFYYLVPM